MDRQNLLLLCYWLDSENECDNVYRGLNEDGEAQEIDKHIDNTFLETRKAKEKKSIKTYLAENWQQN